MKNLLSKHTLLALFAFVLVFSSCDKNEDDPDPDVQQEAACKLTQMKWGDSDADNIEYNNKGNVSKISSSGNDYQLFIYDSNDRLTKLEEYDNGRLNSYLTLSYTGNNLTKMNFFEADGTSDGSETLKYDAQGRVNEILIEEDDDDYKVVFTYNSQGNVEKREGFENGTLMSRTVYANYDDKNRLWVALKGFPYYWEGSGKNNPGRETTTYFENGQPELQEFVSTYTYTYNDKGFPTRVVEDYSGSTYTTNFTYQCN